MVGDLTFPDGFLWGAATAAHQVEGDNVNSDWWEWEQLPDTPCAEPSGAAIGHYGRYPDDVGMLAGLGLNAYRYSVEWARVEPTDGAFDPGPMDHYRRMTDSVREAGMTPVVTLNHFTLPRWLARRGGWRWSGSAPRFARYAEAVARSLGDSVDWYCTINEPGVVAFGGYAGGLGFPPGTRSLASWERASAGLVEGHRLGRAAVKVVRPDAMVGATHSMQEWNSNAAGRPLLEFMRRMNEDVFLEASADDDFIGIQTYTRQRVDLPAALGPLASLAVGTRLGQRAMTQLLRSISRNWSGLDGGRPPLLQARTTQMGYEFWPEALAATIRRALQVVPGKPILVTEHGVATDDDTERVEFIRRGLVALHELIEEGVDVRGYLYWSAFDNFEWARGYAMRFGLIGVDRVTQARAIKPSARFLGEVARNNRLGVAGVSAS